MTAIEKAVLLACPPERAFEPAYEQSWAVLLEALAAAQVRGAG